VKFSLLHPFGRCDIPSGRSSIKNHLSKRRELSVRNPISVQKLQTVQGCIRSDVSATHPDVIQCSTSNRVSVLDTVMGRRMQTVQMSGLHRPDAVPGMVSLHSLDAQSLLWKLRAAEVQPSGC